MLKIKATRALAALALILYGLVGNLSPAAAIGSGNCVSTTSGLTATATESGTTCIVIFTAGSGTWTLPSGTFSVTYLIVGGGGGASRGTCSTTYGPGGGGGAVVTGTTSLSGALSVTVGAGGAALASSCPNTSGNPGSASVLATISAAGGGAAGVGRTGGTSGNGNVGGTSPASGCGECYAGGGGGAGGVGGAGGTNNSMNGGAGVSSSLSGTPTSYGGGGGGRSSTYYGTATAGGGTGNGTCTGAVNSGGGGADCASSGGGGGSGIVIAVYQYDHAPVIGAFAGADSGSYSVNENTSSLYNINATDADAGTTLTYSLTGTDSGDFTISSSGAVSFLSSPDYEAPVDSDTNNIYIVITWVSDGVLSDSQTVTISVNNLTENGTISLPSITGSPTKGLNLTATVNVNTAGKVTFLIDGKRVVGCLSKSAVGTYPNLVATCTWKPARLGRQLLTALFTPSNVSFLAATSPAQTLWVVKRTTTR
jgi:hypothetical protein